MQFVSGRIVFVGNNQVILKQDYSFSSVIFVIKKKMDGKIRNICFECIGKLADEVLKLRIDDKIEVKYLITSSLRNGNWYTNLKAKEVFKIEAIKKINNESQLKIQDYDTLKKGFE